jgi:pyruvate dehydrogenase E1 component alpha subunit
MIHSIAYDRTEMTPMALQAVPPGEPQQPIRFLAEDGSPEGSGAPPVPVPALRTAYRAMVIGRRFEEQATALARQGDLAVYPSAYGQEACQVGAVLALRRQDWLLPTYRDSMAVLTRGVDPAAVLTLMRGSWHCGYDPRAHRIAPQCTPLATHAPHAVGLALAARSAGDDAVALVLCGDGATSEGDFHEALNFAAVLRAPVVFLVQNNGYAISVPLRRQTAARSLVDKAIGYGMAGALVDGNDVSAVLHVVGEAVERARSTGGPALVEALTYRVAPHTNSDDDRRYRDQAEVAQWRQRDPVARLRTYLRSRAALDDAAEEQLKAEAETLAAGLRQDLRVEPEADPGWLFQHVFATPTPQLREQAAQLVVADGSGTWPGGQR